MFENEANKKERYLSIRKPFQCCFKWMGTSKACHKTCANVRIDDKITGWDKDNYSEVGVDWEHSLPLPEKVFRFYHAEKQFIITSTWASICCFWSMKCTHQNLCCAETKRGSPKVNLLVIRLSRFKNNAFVSCKCQQIRYLICSIK